MVNKVYKLRSIYMFKLAFVIEERLLAWPRVLGRTIGAVELGRKLRRGRETEALEGRTE